MTDFVVLKKTFTYFTCPACDGTGVKARKFRAMNFVEDCATCEGEGRKRHVKSEEVPLVEALEELNLLKPFVASDVCQDNSLQNSKGFLYVSSSNILKDES